MITLAERFPDLAQQWDYEKNVGLTPDRVSYGSHLKVWWKCPICNHSYQKKICNRTAPAKRSAESDKCPICLGRVIIPGYNSLKARYPEIVAKEWDYEKNSIDPDTIAPNTNKKVWWRCPVGHSYSSTVNNKIQHNGGDCPYCASQRLCRETSLGVVNPELAREWHPTKNGNLTPFDLFANTNKYIWWLCPTCGHEWRAKCSNRNIGRRGCPHCANSRSSSVPEQLLYRAVKKYFPDAINRHIIDKDEIDVFIPSLNIGMEYDGQRFHNEAKLPKDIAKTKRLTNKGFAIYRFRESNCPDMSLPNCVVIIVDYSPEYSDLEMKLHELLMQMLPGTSIEVDFDDEINEVRAELDCLPYEKSFAASEERKRAAGIEPIALWDYETNAPLTPEMVMPYSEKIVSWICPGNSKHKWRNTLKSVSLGYGCSRCHKRHRYTTEEWIEEARKVHGDKYNYDLVEYVDSKTKVKIVCHKHGVFEQNPSEHLAGKNCPYCLRLKFHPSESLAVLYPDIAAEWDYELNKDSGYTPETIGLDTRRKFWWHCNNGRNHSYLATIAKRVSGLKCAVCHGKQVSSDTSLGSLYPHLVREWCSDNDKSPFDVTPRSEYRAIWKCCNPNHLPFVRAVYYRTKYGMGCPQCRVEQKNRK